MKNTVIKQLRQAWKLTQEEIARALNMPIDTWIAYERGTLPLTDAVADKIAGQFGIDAQALMRNKLLPIIPGKDDLKKKRDEWIQHKYSLDDPANPLNKIYPQLKALFTAAARPIKCSKFESQRGAIIELELQRWVSEVIKKMHLEAAFMASCKEMNITPEPWRQASAESNVCDGLEHNQFAVIVEVKSNPDGSVPISFTDIVRPKLNSETDDDKTSQR